MEGEGFDFCRVKCDEDERGLEDGDICGCWISLPNGGVCDRVLAKGSEVLRFKELEREREGEDPGTWTSSPLLRGV